MNKILGLLFAAVSLGAQPQPQFVWQGEVDGASVIHVRGNRVDIEDRRGAPVQRDRHRFYERLPEFGQIAEVRVIQSRGQVRIIGQPAPKNNFTLSVLIEDLMGGRGFYSLAFFWQGPSRGQPQRGAPVMGQPAFSGGRVAGRAEERLTWTGQVDDEVVVECRGNECRTQTMRGIAARADRFYFSRPLPNSELRVSLDEVHGRGDVQLVEHPAAHNGYTAKVRIRDGQNSAGDYSFSLFWSRPAHAEPERLFARPGLVWAGRVDGIVRVVVDGSSAAAQVIVGGALENERSNFIRPLPHESLPNAALKKLRGRGRVDFVEFPTSRNGWRLVFEVNDEPGGADSYEIEVGW